MELTKTKSKIVTDPSELTALWYGEEGIGKTTLLSQMDSPYIIATEPGHKCVSVFKTEVSTWEEFCDVARELMTNENHGHKTIGIDTVTNLVDFCASSVYEKHNISHMSDLEWGKGFALVRDEFKRVLVPLCNNSRMGVVFVAHDNLKEMTFHGAKRDVWAPNMIKTAFTVLNQLVDLIGRMYIDTAQIGDKMQEYRYIRFAKSTDMVTKDRSGLLERHGSIRLPEKDKMWSTIVKCFREPVKETK